MSLRELSPGEWELAMQAMSWACGPEAAELDLELALQVRRVARPGRSSDEAWERAWVATCRLVMMANEANLRAVVVDSESSKRQRAAVLGANPPRARWVPMSQEPIVIEAARLLQATKARACGLSFGHAAGR